MHALQHACTPGCLCMLCHGDCLVQNAWCRSAAASFRASVRHNSRSREGLIDHKLLFSLLTSTPEMHPAPRCSCQTQLKAYGLQEYEARWFFQQLIVALDYCHRLGVVSRDVSCRIAQPFCVDACGRQLCSLYACFPSQKNLADLLLVCCR